MPRRRRLVASKSCRDDEEQRCKDAGGGMAPSVEATEAVWRRVGDPYLVARHGDVVGAGAARGNPWRARFLANVGGWCRA